MPDASWPQRYRLLPPLTVLELLQQSQAVTLDAVKVGWTLRANSNWPFHLGEIV